MGRKIIPLLLLITVVAANSREERDSTQTHMTNHQTIILITYLVSVMSSRRKSSLIPN